jgi:hypothetical protein
MIRFVLALFGYVKVPREGVELARRLEEEWTRTAGLLAQDIPWRGSRATYVTLMEAHIRAVKAIREFLTTGKMVNL